ncbi:IS66-like element accessory protein TnpA [Pseudosulfitobacter pseudonitzschiae]|uniref:IS66-like element accessory protein TnpA n=1 Tax=Pseudosulfitobacter pseudonitzschiae TaxID=1402135 RepID=UPI001AF947DF|nr:transposase [Pseudosulfitobacter pseudonitzschiae]MBM1818159.1 transposase [Pseudosulfitobacter pseudonitzschiae]MBM1835193.1 transposase [Pseudosulfitobacter pseudonitzschiae]MBM1840061.1 transposase [Pseudosulfitobacter pseudonitzschiae]MBM1844925.1 transposase [Pseudosulfitobacter pseudonitzschiae]MBM1849768.1 transposase [Pseudosulfitobacter pseudonitzschiae]
MSDFVTRPQIEVLSAADGERRRSWSDDDKLRIVEESFIGHRQAAATARRHGICRSLLTTWRRQYRDGELGASRAVSFAPVTVTKAPTQQTKSVDPCPPTDCQVEVVLPNGRRIIVPVGVELEALARILSVVDG